MLDASSPTLFCGVVAGEAWQSSVTRKGDALETIPEALRETGVVALLRSRELRSIRICVGPGSILGIRLTLMTVLGWRHAMPEHTPPLQTYRSLHAAAALMEQEFTGETRFCVVSEFRRGMWNRLDHTHGESFGALQLATTEELEALSIPLRVIAQRNRAGTPPRNAKLAEYDLGHNPAWMHRIPWETPDNTPEVHLALPQEYRKWTPDRHR